MVAFRTFSRAMALVAGALSFGLPASARAESTWTATDDDALLFDLRLGRYRLGDGVRGYQTPTGVCVDTGDMILALDVSIRLDKKLRRATGWAFTESNTLTIDRENNIEQIANIKRNLAANVIYDTPEGWCTDVDALARWFGVGLKADTANALLILTSDTKLPVETAMERRERAARIRPIAQFDLKTLPQAPIPYSGVKAPSVDAVIDLGLTGTPSNLRKTARYALYASGEAGPVAYDARIASDDRGVPQSLRLRAYRNDPEGGLLGPLKATQVAAGDVTSFASQLTSQSTIGRGASISNRPLEREQTFDRTNFRGELPAGWDAELYRNEQLLAIAVDRADGRYEFLEIPLLYGQNRFEVVLYGPQGQVRREERMVMVGPDSIPPRETWYSASIVQDGKDLIDFGSDFRAGTQKWRGSFVLERGLNTRTSAIIGLHSLGIDKVGRRNFVEAGLRRAIGPALVEINGASDLRGGSSAGLQLLAQFGNTYVSAESFRAFGGFRSERFRNNNNGEHRVTVDRLLKVGRATIPVHVGSTYLTRYDGGSTLVADTRISTRFGRFNVSSFLEYEREKRPTGPDPPDTMTAGFLGNARVGRVSLRGEARFRVAPTRSFERFSLTGEWAGKGDSTYGDNWRTQLEYDARADVGRATLGYVRRFDKFAITAQAGIGTDRSVRAGVNLLFSFGPDPRKDGGFRLTSSRIASQGQILARVYRDKNADGQRQADEPWEKNVQLTAGRVPVTRLTDQNGEVVIEDLTPFHAVLVGIDASSLADPLMQPSGPGKVITPRPGITGTLELAITSTGEVDGNLVSANGGGAEGVELELVDARGAVIASTRSDFDGFFLFEQVPFGAYTLRIAKVSAEVLQVAPLGTYRAAVNDDTPAAHLGVIALQPLATRTVDAQSGQSP